MKWALVLLAACADPAFAPAAHPSLANGNIANQGGVTLAHARLVLVTFAGDPLAGDLERFGAWLPTSSWWTAVGAEYGIGAGTSLGHVVLPDEAPTSIDVAGLGALLAARVRDHTLPSDPDPGIEADTIYAVVFPPQTTTHVVAGDAGCAAAAGFHASYSDGQLMFVFSATPEACASLFPTLDTRQFTELDASHEIYEAVTDPFIVGTNGTALAAGPIGWELRDQSNPWFGLGGELADGCTARNVVQDGFTVQRIWSNQAATAGADPCVPAVPPMYGTAPPSDAAIRVAAGQQTTVTLTGWSDGPAPAWMIHADAAPFITSSFVPTASVDTTRLTNGATATLTIGAPAGTPSGSKGYVFVVSRASGEVDANWSVWPLLVTVP